MKLKPFKAWLLWDRAENYTPTIHRTRKDAVADRDYIHIVDAKWAITRVEIRPTSTRSAK